MYVQHLMRLCVGVYSGEPMTVDGHLPASTSLTSGPVKLTGSDQWEQKEMEGRQELSCSLNCSGSQLSLHLL